MTARVSLPESVRARESRIAEALHPDIGKEGESEETETEIDAAMSFSDREQQRGMDFEKMSLEELARAKAHLRSRLLGREAEVPADGTKGARNGL